MEVFIVKEITMDISHLPKQPGVYKITNTENGFVYTGSAERQGIYKRLSTHICQLRNNKHHSWILQQDWNKYGDDKFKAEVILLCSPEESKKIEQSLIDARGVGRDNKSYNVAPDVYNTIMAQETINKIKMSLRAPGLILSSNKSGYKGVCFYKREQKWKASIGRYGHCYHIGYYKTPEEASEVYQKINALSDNEFESWWKNEYETKRKNGKYRPRGENAPWTKLKDKDIDEIRKLWNGKIMNQKLLGEKYGVDPGAISNIVNNKRRKTNEQRQYGCNS